MVDTIEKTQKIRKKNKNWQHCSYIKKNFFLLIIIIIITGTGNWPKNIISLSFFTCYYKIKKKKKAMSNFVARLISPVYSITRVCRTRRKINVYLLRFIRGLHVLIGTILLKRNVFERSLWKTVDYSFGFYKIKCGFAINQNKNWCWFCDQSGNRLCVEGLLCFALLCFALHYTLLASVSRRKRKWLFRIRRQILIDIIHLGRPYMKHSKKDFCKFFIKRTLIWFRLRKRFSKTRSRMTTTDV